MLKRIAKQILPSFTHRRIRILYRKYQFLTKVRRLKRRAEEKQEFIYSEDYFSKHIPILKHHLREFIGKENIRLLEIGSFEGRSAVWFLQNVLTHPESAFVCIDPFWNLKHEIAFFHNLKLSGASDKATPMKGLSEEILPTLKEKSFDIIYIDGSHMAMNVLMDAVSSWLLLKPGGVIIFDDYRWEPAKPEIERPKMAIDLFLNAFQSQLEILHHDYQVIVKKSLG